MQTFFLVRHGQTDWNELGKLQGHSDIPLNERGRAQALQLFSTLLQLGISSPLRILTSDLQRAKQTAEILSYGALAHPGFAVESLRVDERLREVNLGLAEGCERSQIPEKFGQDLWTKWSGNLLRDYDLFFPGGESKNQAIQRFVKALFDHLPQADSTATLVVVTHGLLIRAFCHHPLNEGPEKTLPFLIPNCSVLQFSVAQEKFHFERIQSLSG